MNILTFCFYDQYWLRYSWTSIANGFNNGGSHLGFPKRTGVWIPWKIEQTKWFSLHNFECNFQQGRVWEHVAGGGGSGLGYHQSFVGDILGYSKIFFVDFCNLHFYEKIDSKCKFLKFSWFAVQFECRKWVRRSKKFSRGQPKAAYGFLIRKQTFLPGDCQDQICWAIFGPMPPRWPPSERFEKKL